MHLREMTGAKWHIHKYMVLSAQSSFFPKVSSSFAGQDSQNSYRFGKIKNVGRTKVSEEKISV